MYQNPVDHKVDNSLAAIWSMMLPGLGQLMKGQVMPGIFWALLVGFGYFSFFWPGLVLHAGCILDAAFNKGDKSNRVILAAVVLALIVYIIFRNF